MIRYQHVLSYVASTLWAITTEKLDEMLAVLAFRASGGAFTAEEIRARLGAERDRDTGPSKRGAVAVIPIRGVIAHRMGAMDDTSGGTSAERIGLMVQAAAADESIGTIVYDIDSPGGTVPGIQELAAQMFALRGVKRQVAQVNSMAASAAYWLASQTDEIVSIPSGSAGSIGVFTAHQNLQKHLEQEGIDVTLITAGKFKTEGHPFGPLSDEARDVLQARVDTAYTQFVKDVARGRGVEASAVKGGFGEGRVLYAKDAKAAGLIDRIATMDETLAWLTGRGSRSAAGMRAEEDADLLPSGLNLDVARYEKDGETITAVFEVDASEADRRRRLERF